MHRPVSTLLLVLALASFVLGNIATIAYFWGAALLLVALTGFGAVLLARSRSRSRTH